MPRRIVADDHYGAPMPPPFAQAHQMSENELKHAVLKMARDRGWAVYHVPQTTMRNGGGSGYPDLTLARDKEVIWMELKNQWGQPSPQQLYWLGILPFAHLIRPADLASGRVAELLD